jgi:N-acetylmuramoyl-L-alanine amidase
MIDYIIVHHTGGTDANPKADSSNYTVKQCDADHKQRFDMKSSLGWYVGYTFYIEKDGTVTQTRAIGEEGAHTVGKNKNSIGICLAGNFDVTLPTEAQILSLKKLLLQYTTSMNIKAENIVPHRMFATKSCYGSRLPERWARDLIKDTGVVTKSKDQIKQEIKALVDQL